MKTAALIFDCHAQQLLLLFPGKQKLSRKNTYQLYNPVLSSCFHCKERISQGYDFSTGQK